jgi:hypothetical protein
MASFNLFSQFEPFVRRKLDSRVGKPDVVSKLNTWVRLFSSKYNENDQKNPGLILVSNPDYKLFRAAGDTTVPTIYGGGTQSGVIGVSWSGKPIYDAGGVGLRPSPVVTSIEVDEGMSETLSRKATITIKAFTQQQMEKITEYFLEPGFTVFFEWGWNTRDAARQIQSFDNDVDKVLEYIKDTNNFTKLSERRATSNGDYDSYLGYIIGGGVTTSGTSWDITVELSGLPEIPFYLRSQKSRTANTPSDVEINSTDLFEPTDISSGQIEGNIRFMNMYNALPSKLQIPEIRSLLGTGGFSDANNYLNFNTDIRTDLNNGLSGNSVRSSNFSRTVTRDIGSDANITKKESTIKFPSGQIISESKYIRLWVVFEFIKILTKSFYKNISDDAIEFNIDSNNVILSAFPNIFSLHQNLFIPNKNTPKYTLASLVGEKAVDRITETMDNSIGIYSFPQTGNLSLNGKTIKNGGEWGSLSDLYINFEFMKKVLDSENFTVGDVIKNLLNGVSKAVDGYWNFQIIEDYDEVIKNGETKKILKLKIIDQKLAPNYTDTDEYTFTNVGEKSIFMDSSFSLDIGGAMTNRIIGQRLSNNTNSNEPQTGLFSIGSKDKVLAITDTRTSDTTNNNTDATNDTETEDRSIESELEIYLEKVSMIPNPQLIKITSQNTPRDTRGNQIRGFIGVVTNQTTLEDVVILSSYNDKELFESFHFLDEKKKESNNTDVSPLLPIKFSFTVHGISGIKRFDIFKVKGIPKQYEDGGFFQVTSIKHSIQDMKWSTTVEGQFRNKLNRGQSS